MAENKESIQSQYISWLSTQVSPSQMSELYFNYLELESFCLQIKVLKKPLFETKDIKTLAAVKQTIESNKVFRFKNKNQLKKMSSAMKYYYNWSKDNQNSRSEETIISAITDYAEINLTMDSKKTNISDKKNLYKSENNGNLLYVDFRKSISYAFTKIEYLEFFGERYYKINNWTNLYVQLLKCLFNNYSNIIYNLKGCSFSERGRVDISEVDGISRMSAPKQFTDDLYVETNFSATDIVYKIKIILDKCNVDYEGIIIAYTSKKNTMQIDKSIFRTPIEKNLKDSANFFDSSDKIKINSMKDEPYLDLTQYEKLIFENYQKGFRIESGIEMQRFRKFWELEYNISIEETDETIRKYIRKLTIQYKDFVYIPETMVGFETQKHLINHIEQSFSKGKNAIYYDSLYKEFEIELKDKSLNNSDMLKTYLNHINKGNYVVNRSYLTKDSRIKVDSTDEVREYLIAYGSPLQMEDLVEGLSEIPKEKIFWAVSGNNSAEFIRNQKGEYFHADIVDLMASELDNIIIIIQHAISEKDFIGGNELIEIISAKYPSILERYSYITNLGLRDAIGYKLRDVFSFKGKIISALGVDLSMSDVFANYAKSHEHFSLTQLKALKIELDTPIYFDSVYLNSLRIDKENFVSKEQVNFDSIEIDAAIDRFCIDDYITISEIKHFGSFPYVGFSWNGFLLEHYVSDYSKNYKLMHSSFNAGASVGAIVKRTAEFENFDELITNALSKSTISLNKQDALQYLCDSGFLARRSYASIERILDNAKAQR